MSNIQLINNKFVLIEPLEERELKPVVTGAMARISQSVEVRLAMLISELRVEDRVYKPFESLVLLPSDAAFQQWNKQVYYFGDIKFVKCPIDYILGIIPNNKNK